MLRFPQLFHPPTLLSKVLFSFFLLSKLHAHNWIYIEYQSSEKKRVEKVIKKIAEDLKIPRHLISSRVLKDQKDCRKGVVSVVYLCFKKDTKTRKLIKYELYHRTLGKFKRF